MELSLLELIIHGFKVCTDPYNLFLAALGMGGGIIAGALPGIGPSMSIALLIPFSMVMGPYSGMILLGAIWTGATYGGSIAAVLFKVPGTPASVATTFDGYPMTQKGEGDKALFICLLASAIGGSVGCLALMFLFIPLAKLSLMFSKPEYFWLCVLGLTAISSISGKSVAKGAAAACIGLLICTIGMDPLQGIPRFTFGFTPLVQGIHLVPGLIGVFAFSQMLKILEEQTFQVSGFRQRGILFLLREVSYDLFTKCKTILLRSSIIGTIIGILPGTGTSIASIIGYNEAVRWDKNPEKYGTGVSEGVAASEAANNAVIGSSCIPMMALAIPGCPAAAIIMGAFMAHGINPGSKLLIESGDIAFVFITSLLFVNLVMLVVGALILRLAVNVIRVPAFYVSPVIMVLCTLGAYSIRNSILDVFVMIAVGVLSYLVSKVDIPPGPLALGLVLGPIAEEALGVSLLMAKAKGSIVKVLFLRPMVIVIILLCIMSALTPILLNLRMKKRKKVLVEK